MKRFWSKVRKTDGCWEWMAGKDRSGYGKFRPGRRDEGDALAHRVSAAIAGMDIEGSLVLHHCDNPSCVNPEHLYVGSNSDNMRDKTSRNRQARGESCGRSVLTEDAVHWMRASGLPQSVIAEWAGVNQTTVSRIQLRQTWKHI